MSWTSLRGVTMEFVHKPVLLNECIENLNIKPDGIYLDGTLGGAGHSLEIAKLLSDKGMLIGIDRDVEAMLNLLLNWLMIIIKT